LAESLAQLAAQPPEFIEQVKKFLDSLISHAVLDDGKLVVAHAGMKEAMQGRGSGTVREFALFGETTGETDEFGLPVRYNWAAEYKGRAMVVYGHTPVPEPEWLNNTINIDTGCVFGGALSALRYPERELVSVPALQTYAEPVRPLVPKLDEATLTQQQQHDDVLEIDGVLGKKYIQTGLMKNIIIAHENAVTALEVMSRFTINPKWLIYLPPTMAPTESHRGEAMLLEHPSEAFAYFAKEGVTRVVCEEKHMGSRAIVVVGRDEAAVRKRFGISSEGLGVVYTRTGRRFFDEVATEQAFVTRVRDALTRVNWWKEFKSDWFCLDCELMPWSAKAQGLLKEQYAAVGAAAQMALREAVATLQQTRVADVSGLLAAYQSRAETADRFVEAYRRYCWPVHTLEDYKLAPFHVLASEGAVHTDKDHAWHMTTLAALCDADVGILHKTQIQIVELNEANSVAQGVDWWLHLTEGGGEGMVVKPQNFISQNSKGLVQPGVKVRGREYLRIIYGPEYDAPEHLARLRVRNVHGKRRLALREFALGVESLERFVRREPLARVHECVFGVLALESEPMDPRL
ncbi:MAG: polynucleotide kinase-phosphatase, partial [Anaerolineae bacterium]|nr:polynucleotide kinase-phosphatase [Anaerolineae bacterium]